MTSNSGSIGILNSSGNRGDPCLTPRVIPFSLRQPGTSCKDHPRNAQPSNVTQSCRLSSLLSWLVISLSKKFYIQRQNKFYTNCLELYHGQLVHLDYLQMILNCVNLIIFAGKSSLRGIIFFICM